MKFVDDDDDDDEQSVTSAVPVSYFLVKLPLLNCLINTFAVVV